MGNRVMEDSEVEGGAQGKKVKVKMRGPKKREIKATNDIVVKVEMMGRNWALNPKKLKVGDYMTGGQEKGDSSNGFRVLAVKDKTALLLVK